MKFQKIFIYLLFILSIAFNQVMASDMVDSLKSRLHQTRGIENIKAQLDLSYYYRRLNTTKAREFAQSAMDVLQTQYNNPELETKAQYCLGLTYYYDRDYPKALELFFRSVTESKEQDNDYLLSELYFFIGASHFFYYGDIPQSMGYYNQCIHYGLLSGNHRILGAVYSALSNILRVSGSYEKSLEFIFQSRENYEAAGYKEGIAWVNYMMGSLYNTVGLYEDAKEAYNQSLTIYRELAVIDSNMTGVAICLDQLCVVNTALGNEDLARKYNQEALNYYKQEKSDYGISNALKYRADLENNAGNDDLAISLLDSSLEIKKLLRDEIGLSSIYALFGKIYIDKGENQRALDSLWIGLRYARENNQMKYKVELNKYIARAYEKLGEYENAYIYKAREFAIADSIFNTKSSHNMVQLETLFEIERKEKEIDALEQEKLISDLTLNRQRNLQNYLIVLIGLALIVILMFFYLYRQKTLTNIQLTESKKLVEEINVTKDKFFSILAHDLRNPFNSILGLVRILNDKHQTMDEEERGKIIKALYESANNNYDLLNNLLEWSRTQRGTLNFMPETFNLNETTQKIRDNLLATANEKQITIEIDPNPIEIFADQNMIKTVLRNLISNAIKYSNKGERVMVEFVQEPSQLHVLVRDFGIGMKESDIRRLFKIGENFNNPGTAGEKGTGLGLIICKEFIDEHRGKIWVESEPGKGSTFHFTIPVNH